MWTPETRFGVARDGTRLAYQVSGTGDVDIVFQPPSSQLIDLLWQEPGFVHVAKRLDRFARTVWYDGRGSGASGGDSRDRLAEETVDADLTTVLDAVGCERVALIGTNPDVIRYAAAHAGRLQALVLINGFAHYVREHDYPWGLQRDMLDQYEQAARSVWGSAAGVDVLCPSMAGDRAFRERWALAERLGIGIDDGATALLATFEQDARSLLPRITVPTLVVHRADNRFIHVGAGRYLAEHIPGAKYVELPGADQPYYVGDTDELFDEIEEFLTGARSAPEGDVLTASLMFTDIVASTEQAARLGHRRWTALTDAHDSMVRRILARHRGHEVKTLGDGFLATFDATTRALRAATEIVTEARDMGLAVRVGVHVGEVETRPDDVVGLPVNVAKRICDLAGAGEVFVSHTVCGLATGSGIRFVDRGTHELKGVPDIWQLFAVAQ